MGSSNTVLAFDTALAGCTVSVLTSGQSFPLVRPMLRGQSEQLVPLIEEALEQAGAKFSDIDLIVTTVGPGAFTGVRIGLATARALSLSLEVPVAGVTTLEVLAQACSEKNDLGAGQKLAVLLETKRKDFYGQLFNADGSEDTEPLALDKQALADLLAGENLVITGDILERFGKDVPQEENWSLKDGYELLDPCVMARLGLQKHAAGIALPPEPVYLRPADVSKSKRKPRQIAKEVVK